MSRWKTSVTMSGREVRNPALRGLVSGLVIVYSVIVSSFMLALMAVVVCLFIALSPVLVPLHFVLVALGRRGFVTRDGQKISIRLSDNAFHKIA